MKLGVEDSDMLLFGDDAGDVFDDMSLFDDDVEHDFENDFYIPNVSEELNNEEATNLSPGVMEFISSLANSTVQITLPNLIAQYPLGTVLPPQFNDLLPHHSHAYTIHLSTDSSVQDDDEDDAIMHIKYLFAMNVEHVFQNDIHIQGVLEELYNDVVTILAPMLMQFITVDNSTAPHTLSNSNPLYPFGTILPHHVLHPHVGSSAQDSNEDDAFMDIKYLFSMNEVSEEHLGNESDVVETTDNW